MTNAKGLQERRVAPGGWGLRKWNLTLGDAFMQKDQREWSVVGKREGGSPPTPPGEWEKKGGRKGLSTSEIGGWTKYFN